MSNYDDDNFYIQKEPYKSRPRKVTIMPTPTQSPGFILPPIDTSLLQMDFFEALEAVAAGEKITKLEWADPEYYGAMIDGKLMLHKPNSEYSFYPWIISDGDVAGTDYVIVS